MNGPWITQTKSNQCCAFFRRNPQDGVWGAAKINNEFMPHLIEGGAKG